MGNIVKLRPIYMEKIWGYEKWILSTHKSGISFVDGDGRNLLEYLNREIPILVKEIKTTDTLSVQVHPSDEYANKHENDNGKTECWYILDACENASLICGMNRELSRDKFLYALENGDIDKILKSIPVSKGDMIYIPAGVVHAIGKGIKLVEIQQCSDVTYRIYDWGRDREVHIDKALDVINFKNIDHGGKIENFKLLKTPYFTVEKIKVYESIRCESGDNFNVYFCINGNGIVISESGNNLSICTDDVIYVEKDTSHLIKGNVELLKIY